MAGRPDAVLTCWPTRPSKRVVDVKLLAGAMTVDQSALTGESKDGQGPGGVLSSGSVVRRGEGTGAVMLTGAGAQELREQLLRKPSLLLSLLVRTLP
jgi:hypothetical protein